MPLIQSYATGNVGPGDEGQGTPFGPGKQPGGTTPTPPTDEEWQEAYDEFEQNLIEDQFEQQQEWQDYEDPQTGTDVEEQWVDPGMDEYSEWTATQANLSDFNVGRRYADILNAGGTLKDFYRDLTYSLNEDVDFEDLWNKQEDLFSSVAYNRPQLFNISFANEMSRQNLLDKYNVDQYDRQRGQTGVRGGSGLYQHIGKEKRLQDYENAAKQIDLDLQLKERGFYSDIGSNIWDLLSRFVDVGGMT